MIARHWLLLIAVAAAAVPRAGAGAPVRADTTRVAYVAGSSIYIDAGRDRGLAEGDTVRLGEADGMSLKVAAVSSSRAVCRPLGGAPGLARIGDVVLFRPGAGRAAETGAAPSVMPRSAAGRDSAAAAPSKPVAGPPAARRPFRGRVGLGYLRVDGPGTGYSRPAADLRLEGRSAWGAPLDFAIDVRGHRLERVGGSTESAARVYRLSVSSSADDGSRRFTAGRQSIAIATAPGQFDGVSFEYGSPSWTAGLFSGFEPVRYGYDFDPGVLWTGIYAGARGASGSRLWGLTLGGMDAHDHGVPSREALFAQATYHDGRFSLFGAQAADLNSAWKRARGEPSISSTSTLVTGEARLWGGVTAVGGYDGRRNVLLARDRETPETAFDDRFRQGGWGGLSIEPGWASRLEGTARWTSGGVAGTARAWTGSAERRSIPPFDGTLSLRSSRVESDIERGWLHAASLSLGVGGASEIALSGGYQDVRDSLLGTTRKSAWQAIDADKGIGAHWYALLQGERESGDEGTATTGYAGLSWRF